MGTTLNGTTPQNTYPSLIKVGDNTALTATAKYLSDGEGNDSALSLSTDKVGVGTNTPTARLHVKGSGTTSATTAFLVQNSAGTDALTITDDRNATFGNVVFSSGGFRLTSVSELGLFCRVTTTNAVNPQPRLFSAEGNASQTINPTTSFHDIRNFIPTLGSALFTSFQFSGTINQTGGANGITRGLFINPTVTAAADFRAIETSAGGAYINTSSVNASAILQADSTTKGFLPPRMTTAQKNAIVTPAAGLVVYDTDLNKLCVFTTVFETITSV